MNTHWALACAVATVRAALSALPRTNGPKAFMSMDICLDTSSTGIYHLWAADWGTQRARVLEAPG